MTLSADAIDPGLVTELHAQLEAARNALRDWQRRAETALRLAESHGKELADLRASLAVEPDDDKYEARSSAYWFASWREVQRLRLKAQLRIAALEREVDELRCLDSSAFIDGELTPERADKFRDHLARCKICQDELKVHLMFDAAFSSASATRGG